VTHCNETTGAGWKKATQKGGLDVTYILFACHSIKENCSIIVITRINQMCIILKRSFNS
jgi:hypothetical protein